MLKKITLKNFMSHRLTELDLVEGVNVLIGPNNCGKSAIVSALQLVAELPPKEGGYMVRHGEKEAQVVIKTQEEDTITWGRRGKVNYLEINGKPHCRLGNDQQHYLDVLHKVLRLPQIKNKDESFDLHFAKQKEPIFLLNEPSTRAAAFFSISSDAGRLLEMRELFKSKVSRAKEKHKNLIRKQLSLKQEISHLAPLTDLRIRLVELKETYQKIVDETQALDRGIKEEALFKNNTQKEKALLSEKTHLEGLLPPPECIAVENLEQTIQWMVKLRHQEIEVIQKSTLLAQLLEEKLPLETLEMEEAVQKFSFASSRFNHFDKTQKILEPLLAPPNDLENSLELEELISLMKKEEILVAKKQKEASFLSELLEPVLPQEIEKQQQLVAQIDHLQQISGRLFCQDKVLSKVDEVPHLEDVQLLDRHVLERRNLEKRLLTLVMQVSQDSQALEEWVKEHPSCPTCGAQLEIELGTLTHDS